MAQRARSCEQSPTSAHCIYRAKANGDQLSKTLQTSINYIKSETHGASDDGDWPTEVAPTNGSTGELEVSFGISKTSSVPLSVDA